MNYKKTNISHLIIPTFIFFFNAIIIIFPKEFFAGSKRGLLLWFEKVVPSLFPFMAASSCLIRTNFPQFLGRIIEPVTLPMFNLTGTQAFPLITGLTAGYPLGAKTTAQLYRSGAIPKREAHRLLMFSNSAGPLFILGTVGICFFNSAALGYFLLLCNTLSILLLNIAGGVFFPEQAPKKSGVHIIPFSRDILTSAISDSITSILAVGAYIMIFSVIGEIFAVTHVFDGISALLQPLGLGAELEHAVSIGILEITNACELAAHTPSKAAVMTAAALIGWGGLSVHAQSLEFLDGTDLDCRYYFAGKLLTAVMDLCLADVLWPFFG